MIFLNIGVVLMSYSWGHPGSGMQDYLFFSMSPMVMALLMFLAVILILVSFVGFYAQLFRGELYDSPKKVSYESNIVIAILVPIIVGLVLALSFIVLGNIILIPMILLFLYPLSILLMVLQFMPLIVAFPIALIGAMLLPVGAAFFVAHLLDLALKYLAIIIKDLLRLR